VPHCLVNIVASSAWSQPLSVRMCCWKFYDDRCSHFPMILLTIKHHYRVTNITTDTDDQKQCFACCQRDEVTIRIFPVIEMMWLAVIIIGLWILLIKTSLSCWSSLPPLGHIWDVLLLWRKENIKKTVGVSQCCVLL